MTGPLHQRIRSDIEARIRSGEWTPGHRAPTEAELMAAYDCSRMTVNKAMIALVEAGLIVRRAAGTKRYCSLAPAALEELEQWLAMLRRALETNYDRLDRLLAAIPLDTRHEE